MKVMLKKSAWYAGVMPCRDINMSRRAGILYNMTYSVKYRIHAAKVRPKYGN